MKKAIYSVLGVVIGLLISLTLLMDASNVRSSHIEKNIEIGEVDVVKTQNNFIREQINRLDVLIYELRQKEGYFVTDEKLKKYINSNVISYGRANPMHYVQIDIEIEEEEIEGIEKVESGNSNELIIDKENSIGYDINKKELVSIDIGYIERAFKDDGVLPVTDDYYGVTSVFGLRNDPINKNEKRFHAGLDIAKAGINGQKLYATLDGKIDIAMSSTGYGNYVVINHGGFNTVYAHLEGFSRDIEKGKTVKAGDVIGYVGSTGRSTGPHLHFEVETNGIKLNPEHFLNLVRGYSLENTEDKEGYWPNKTNTTKNEDNKEKDVPKEYQSALKAAQYYLDKGNMSKAAIFDQLSSEHGDKFTKDASQYAIDNLY